MSKKKTVNSTWVTTLDNPFNPFEDMENWKRWDEDHKYYTTELICRYLHDSDELPEDRYYEALEDAVDTVCRFNFTGNYRKLQKPIEIEL